MDTEQIIQALKAERLRIDRAIAALGGGGVVTGGVEGLQCGGGGAAGAGRPAKSSRSRAASMDGIDPDGTLGLPE